MSWDMRERGAGHKGAGRRGIAGALALWVAVVGAAAQEAAQDTHARTLEAGRRMERAAAAWLVAAQSPDGAWAPQAGPGVSALVLKALIRAPGVGPEHPAVARGLRYLEGFQHPDGAIYGGEGLLKNYETAIALSMYAALPAERRGDVVARAQRFLTELQWDETEERSLDDVFYGGAGYGHGRRPDLSNTQFMLDALHDSGLPEDHPAYRKALVFIERCQMLGESNDQAFADGAAQGGFIYSPANGGESKAGTFEVDGRSELRSYGSMTYAGFKSMLYAGLDRDDRRVRAALDWIRAHWTLDRNPNMPDSVSEQGLFYYYHTFARALRAFGAPRITDSIGRDHDWRAELIAELRERQADDGSWRNAADRWMEGVPELATAYAVLAIQEALADD